MRLILYCTLLFAATSSFARSLSVVDASAPFILGAGLPPQGLVLFSTPTTPCFEGTITETTNNNSENDELNYSLRLIMGDLINTKEPVKGLLLSVEKAVKKIEMKPTALTDYGKQMWEMGPYVFVRNCGQETVVSVTYGFQYSLFFAEAEGKIDYVGEMNTSVFGNDAKIEELLIRFKAGMNIYNWQSAGNASVIGSSTPLLCDDLSTAEAFRHCIQSFVSATRGNFSTENAIAAETLSTMDLLAELGY